MKYQDLSAKQKHAFNDILNFALNGDDLIYILNGVAGSGKTSIVMVLNKVLKDIGIKVRNVALTGKAVNVMRNKGLDASTIHSMIYIPIYDEDTDEIIRWDTVGKQELREFYDFLFVDEGSMVTQEILEDLLSYEIPIVIVGDQAQLPAISKEPFNIMESPDFHLDEIHRQAAGNPIILLAAHIRKYGTYNQKFVDKKHIDIINKSDININYFKNNDFDVVICSTNKQRLMLNRLIRKSKGFKGETPKVGETVICLRNASFNGMRVNNGSRFTVLGVQAIKNEEQVFELLPEGSNERVIVRIRDESWDEIAPKMNEPYGFFTFGYAITAHKSQGSEFERVLLYDDCYVKETRKAFRYTGVTRAINRIVIAR